MPGRVGAAGGRRPRARDIAQQLGVSETAVSFALNDRPGISEETRARILERISEMGWTPNYAARALTGARASTVGLVVARSADDIGAEAFFLQLMSGIQSVISPLHYGLLFQIVDSIEEEVAVYRRWSAEKRVDGVVLVDLRAQDPRPGVLADLDLPAVVAGGLDPSGRLPGVAIDDVGAIQLVVEHLVGHGHRRIAYIAGEPRLDYVKLRSQAFRSLTRRTGFAIQVIPAGFGAEEGARAVRDVIESPLSPTALVFENEVLTIAGLEMLRRLGLDVPDDMTVVSFEDSMMCTLVHPRITALHRETARFGAAVAEHLMKVMDGEDAGSVEAALPTLEVRESSGDVPET